MGLIGCGFVAELHMYAYKRVHGVDAAVTAVAARGDVVVDFAGKHQIGRTYRDFRDLLADRDIDVIDICTPPALHAAMIVEGMQAAMGDGSVRRIAWTVSPWVFWAATTPNGAEDLPADW